MTTREQLMLVVDGLDDEQVARLLGYADALIHGQRHPNGTSADAAEAEGDGGEYEDELTHAVPKLGFAPGSSIWDIVGFIKSDGPTDMASDKYKYFAQVYGDNHEE